MAVTKIQDVVVKVGEYEVGDGQKKARYKNIGAIFARDDGGQFLSLDSTIVTMELQYIANPKRSERIVCSLFDANEEGRRQAPKQRAERQQEEPPKAKSAADLDDDIPF